MYSKNANYSLRSAVVIEVDSYSSLGVNGGKNISTSLTTAGWGGWYVGVTAQQHYHP